MQIKIKGIEKAIFSIKKLKHIEYKSIRLLSEDIYKRARGKGTKHGSLGDSVKFRIYKKPHTAGKVWVSNKGKTVKWKKKSFNYAFFVHFGTKPHIIKPKKKALRWVEGNNFIFAKKVNHPGYRGDPFLYIAAKESIKRFETLVKKLTIEV